jgi:hypothetical protein
MPDGSASAYAQRGRIDYRWQEDTVHSQLNQQREADLRARPRASLDRQLNRCCFPTAGAWPSAKSTGTIATGSEGCSRD